MVTRLILALVAVAVMGWSALSVRAADDADRGVVLVARGNQAGTGPEALSEARDAFRRARKFNADADVLTEEASALLLAQYPQEAVDLLGEAVRLEPENAEAWYLLSVANVRGGDREGAARARRRARELDPRIPR